MLKRKTVLPDGRYLIFYTFDNEPEKRARALAQPRQPENRGGGVVPENRERSKGDK